jgi:hypothetical protein
MAGSVEKRFFSSGRATLIQDQERMRNLDSKIPFPGFVRFKGLFFNSIDPEWTSINPSCNKLVGAAEQRDHQADRPPDGRHISAIMGPSHAAQTFRSSSIFDPQAINQ